LLVCSRAVRLCHSLLLAALVLPGCGRSTEVELRLYPCGLSGSAPVRVELEILGYDADGAAMTPLARSFAIADAGVLSDGYATVGLRRPDGMMTADFTLTWRDADDVAEVVVLRGLAVPGPGEVLELGADACAPVDATSTGTTGAETGSSTGTSAGETTGTSAGDDTTTTSSSTSTGDDTTTSTTSSSTGDESSTTGDDSSTGNDTMIGEPCTDEYWCEGGGPGELGTLLRCEGGLWAPANLGDTCPPLLACPPGEFNIVEPVPVGCSGEGPSNFGCLCQASDPVLCDGSEVACEATIIDGEAVGKITLCVDEGEGEVRTQGLCAPSCDNGKPGGPYCTP
jgi:hypothetical protein